MGFLAKIFLMERLSGSQRITKVQENFLTPPKSHKIVKNFVINWADKEEVLVALSKDEGVFRYAPQNIRNKQWAAIAAIQSNELNLAYVSNRLICNPNFLKKVIKISNCFLPLIQDNFRTDKNFCKFLIKEVHPIFLVYAHESFLKCPKFRSFCLREVFKFFQIEYKKIQAEAFVAGIDTPQYFDTFQANAKFQHIVSQCPCLLEEETHSSGLEGVFFDRFRDILININTKDFKFYETFIDKLFSLLNLDIFEQALTRGAKTEEKINIFKLKLSHFCDHHKYAILSLMFFEVIPEEIGCYETNCHFNSAFAK